MKKWTQEEVDQITPDQYGVRRFPTGDYSGIKSFGERCSFGEGCSFGKWCSFGEDCSFGEGCSFGRGCSFGEWGRFGERCSFGEYCSFGEDCSFGRDCSFEAGRISNGRYVAVDRIGSAQRKAYFFKGDEGLFVRAGCWFSSLEDFKARVRGVHSGTRHEREYLAACDLAEMMLED